MIKKPEDKLETNSNRGDICIFECEYPEENPEGALKDIVDCFEHIGIFDGIEKINPDLK